MITLEDQIRRYATDVAGPAVAEPPSDLDVVGHPRHRGRWVLVAALVVFIAGLTWVATRPAGLGDRPTVDTVPLPPLASWAGEWGRCVDQPPPADGIVTGPERIDGIQLEGDLGKGICIGVGRGEPDIEWIAPPLDQGLVWLTADGVPYSPIAVNSCTFRSTTGSYGGAGTMVGDRQVTIYVVAPDVRTVVFTGAGGPISTSSFEVPGVDGFRLVALRDPLPFPQGVIPTAYYDVDGVQIEFPPQTGLPPVPEGCPPAPTIPPQLADGAG